MIDPVILNLVLALTTNEVLHNIIESLSVRRKVARLSAYIHDKPYKEPSFKVNTRAKSYTISGVMFVVLVVIWFVFYTLIDLSVNTALQVMAILLVFAYAVTTVSLDQYHVEIEKVTKPFKNKAK